MPILLAVSLIEGDQTSRINEILKAFNYYPIEDLFETSSFKDAHNYILNNDFSKLECQQEFSITGLCKYWTVIERIRPLLWNIPCTKVSKIVNRKAITISIETHSDFYDLRFFDKGELIRTISSEEGIIKVNDGRQFPLDIDDGVPYVSEETIVNIVKQLTSIDLIDLLIHGRVEKEVMVCVKLARYNIV